MKSCLQRADGDSTATAEPRDVVQELSKTSCARLYCWAVALVECLPDAEASNAGLTASTGDGHAHDGDGAGVEPSNIFRDIQAGYVRVGQVRPQRSEDALTTSLSPRPLSRRKSLDRHVSKYTAAVSKKPSTSVADRMAKPEGHAAYVGAYGSCAWPCARVTCER